MSDDRNGDADRPASSGGPRRPITDTMKKPLARRFYKHASVSVGPPYQILLDGRPVKTPKKRAVTLPTAALADAIAQEWNDQGAQITPATMPITRLANTAIDAVADTLEAVAADIVAFAGSDLLCYRAETPSELSERQALHWDPVVLWAAKTLGARFTVVTGVMPIEQTPATLSHVAAVLEPLEAFRLTGLHVLTTLTGSAILALAHAHGDLSSDDTWAAAHVDEDYQISLWGADAEAEARRAGRRIEFDAASSFLRRLAGLPNSG